MKFDCFRNPINILRTRIKLIHNNWQGLTKKCYKVIHIYDILRIDSTGHVINFSLRVNTMKRRRAFATETTNVIFYISHIVLKVFQTYLFMSRVHISKFNKLFFKQK